MARRTFRPGRGFLSSTTAAAERSRRTGCPARGPLATSRATASAHHAGGPDEPFVERCARFYQALAPAVGMDLLVYTPEEFEAMREGPFLRHALREAKVIYEA